MNMERFRKFIYWMLPVAGVLFGIWYIQKATCDVVYSDYIRLVNSYLPDVYDIRKLLVPDVFTRVPINFLGRIINMELFGYSLTVDRVLGVAGLGLAGWVFALYCMERKIGCIWFGILMAVMFSLNKWEMLTNGSGWCHFLAFACFYYHELVLDRLWSGQEKKHDRIKMILLPWFIILGTAGPYCASYAVILILSYCFCMVRGRSRKEPLPAGCLVQKEPSYLLYLFCVLIPLLLYLISNSYVVEEHAGATGRPLLTILTDNPTFPVRFLLKSFAGILVGGEELSQLMETGVLSNKGCYLIGFFVICGYLSAIWMNLRFRLYDKTILPFMLLAGGGFNHILVFMARYIFEKEAYALNSSRYTLQFQVGILGIILTFALVWQLKYAKKAVYQVLAVLFCIAILWGNGYTTYHEIIKAKYRKERFEGMAAKALEIPGMSDEEFEAQADDLADYYEYWNGNDKIRNAFRILEENKLNVFR